MSYTDVEVATIRSAGPSYTYASTAELAEAVGKSHRSVIAKVKSLGFDYTGKPKATPKGRGVRKADVVADLSARLGRDLSGLEGAKMDALVQLVEALDS